MVNGTAPAARPVTGRMALRVWRLTERFSLRRIGLHMQGPTWTTGLSILAETGGRRFTVEVEAGAAALLADRLEPGLSLGDDLDDEQRALAIAFLVGPQLSPIEAAFGAGIDILSARLRSGADTVPGELRVSFELVADGMIVPGVIRLPAAVSAAAERFLRRLPADTGALAASRMPVALRLGVQRVGFAELRNVRPGDGIVWAAGQHAPRLVIGEQLSAPVRMTDGGIELTARPVKPVDDFEAAYLGDHWAMLEEEDEPERGPLASATVNLVLEVGRIRLSIAEIEALAAGDRLAIGRGPEAPVDLVCGGRVFGSGRLVEMRGTLVVEVLEILT